MVFLNHPLDRNRYVTPCPHLDRTIAMTVQAISMTERRVAPRFQTSFAAEFVSGTVLVPVVVRDLSTAGCGVEIWNGDPDLPNKLGGRGLLHLPAVDRSTYGTILPVVLRNIRHVDRQTIYGLEFVPLLPHQARKLDSVLEAMNETG